MCLFKPSRVIEIASGFSSLVRADANTRMFGGSIDITRIEPDPQDFLVSSVKGINWLVTPRLQDVDVALFDELASGNVLFIDSSHVFKSGGEVSFCSARYCPAYGRVCVHLHDIFLPDKYPKPW